MDSTLFTVLCWTIFILAILVIVAFSKLQEKNEDIARLNHTIQCLANTNSPIKAHDAMLYYAYLYKEVCKKLGLVMQSYACFRADMFDKKYPVDFYKTLDAIFKHQYVKGDIKINPLTIEIDHIPLLEIHGQHKKFQSQFDQLKSTV